MVLETIYVVRHGFRMAWSVDPYTIKYSTNIPTPTGLPTDPALSSYGEKQAQQLGSHILTLDPPISQVISSPYYRCLQTIRPGVEFLQRKGYKNGVLVESGFEEWYGETGDHREQPGPADFEELRDKHFPSLALKKPDTVTIRPSKFGESIETLHARVAYTLLRTIEMAEREAWKSVLICTHAAVMIAVGRILTGRMPEDVEVEDFKCFTASLSRYDRVFSSASQEEQVPAWSPEVPESIPQVQWRGKGVKGGWANVLNGDCSFLEGGEERGWKFSGDEKFLRDPNAFNDTRNVDRYKDKERDEKMKGGGSRL